MCIRDSINAEYMGMAVDANVIIYERIKEELRHGKGLRLSVSDGFKHAMSAIIDGNLTTMLTGIILFIFGTGPIQGFATTLVIGLLTSMFTAIFVSRLVFERLLNKNKEIAISNRFTQDFLHNANVDFMGIRKGFYIFSITITLLGIISISTQGFHLGVDFKGGRTYQVRFDQPVKTVDIQEKLGKVLGDVPEVKTLGTSNQVKITTKYMIDQNDPTMNVDLSLIHISEPTRLGMISYAVFCLKKKKNKHITTVAITIHHRYQ
eukprot:TRINITY_DN22810_c0_g1_i3.p1 TRINITY_DN22810_c0_g1~~TRINITY_DN22810_c0_g1_i3.p1  ORF type:complete len:263 (+),score=16.10 TRINITY_DN22810_c0_g1_i3:178-966(+)